MGGRKGTLSGVRTAILCVVLLATIAVPPSATATGSSVYFGPEGVKGPDCQYPGEVLDLADWKLTLPTGEDEHPDEITQPELDTFAFDPWFVPTGACDGVRFRAAVDGVTTGGSSYPRSELREMDGGDEASWSATDGTHTMTVTAAFTALPNDKSQVVAAQIHDADDDVTTFRLEGRSLYVTDGDTTHHKLVVDDYRLGTPFEAKFVVHDGKVEAYYNGDLQTSIDADFDGGYFKTGAYTQANCGNSAPCDASNFGEVEVYGVTVTHD